jgi:hypothetical protein
MSNPAFPSPFESFESRTLLSTYYVAPTGSDSAPGSSAAPFATLQHAADIVGAGDAVIVRRGKYAGFYLETSGTAAKRITFRAEKGAIINRPNPTTPDGINLEGASYVTIQGFKIVRMARAGIRSVLNHHVTILKNTADSNGKWGILTGFSDDLLIKRNTTSNSIAEHGIYVSNSGDRPTIVENVSFNNRACGIHMNGDISLGGDGIISGARVSRNTIFNNGLGGGSGINGDGVQDSLFSNNLLYDNHASGISLYQIDAGGPGRNNRIFNNTILMAADARWALNIQDGSTNLTVYNNILLTAHSFRGSISISPDSLPGFVSDRNILIPRFTFNGGDSVLSLADWQAETGQDSHSRTSSPARLFVDPGAKNYRLDADSPAIDRGKTLTLVTDDLVGAARPQGSGFDIGAYERLA